MDTQTVLIIGGVATVLAVLHARGRRDADREERLTAKAHKIAAIVVRDFLKLSQRAFNAKEAGSPYNEDDFRESIEHSSGIAWEMRCNTAVASTITLKGEDETLKTRTAESLKQQIRGVDEHKVHVCIE